MGKGGARLAVHWWEPDYYIYCAFGEVHLASWKIEVRKRKVKIYGTS